MFRRALVSMLSSKQVSYRGALCERQFQVNISDQSDISKMTTAPPWREAASIIIAAKYPLKESIGKNLADLKLTRNSQNSVNKPRPKFDYRILMLKRSVLSSFMANAYVFPGGMTETSDYSLRWLDVFKNAGISREELEQSSNFISGPRPPMFSNSVTLSKENSSSECLIPDLSVRISAIRETFEETGILLLTNSELRNKNEATSYGSSNINFNLWRERVHNDPNAFLDMCLEAKVCPNVWCIQEWWNWLTPTNVGHRRYDTMFYICCLSKMPEAQADKSEIVSLKWCNPEEILEENHSGSVFLAPPQIYELSRFLNFHYVQDLHKFSKERELKGIERWMPVIGAVTDGAVSFLPGDDLYPEKPDLEGSHMPLEFPFSLEEIRNRSHNLNRLEINGVICTICSNITPACNHVQPFKHPSNVPLIQSYL